MVPCQKAGLLVSADGTGTNGFILTMLRLRKFHLFKINFNQSNNSTTDQRLFRCYISALFRLQQTTDKTEASQQNTEQLLIRQNTERIPRSNSWRKRWEPQGPDKQSLVSWWKVQVESYLCHTSPQRGIQNPHVLQDRQIHMTTFQIIQLSKF